VLIHVVLAAIPGFCQDALEAILVVLGEWLKAESGDGFVPALRALPKVSGPDVAWTERGLLDDVHFVGFASHLYLAFSTHVKRSHPHHLLSLRDPVGSSPIS
jgi:hypothetical protein